MFGQRCQQADVAGQFGEEIGALSERISQRGMLADLVVLNCGLGAEAGESDSFTREIARVLQHCARPVLVVSGEVTTCRRVLLAFGSHERARAALYVAAYAANAWGADLHVLSVIERGNSAEEAIDSARQYLEGHGIAAEYSFCGSNAAEMIVGLAAEHGCDMIVMGSYNGGWLRERLHGNVVNRVLQATALPVLVCP